MVCARLRILYVVYSVCVCDAPRESYVSRNVVEKSRVRRVQIQSVNLA